MNPLVQLILDLVYPPKCLLCGQIMDSSDESLCRNCTHKDLPEYTALPPEIPHFDVCVPVFYYQDEIRDAILRYKFQGLQNYDRQFVKWMAVLVRDKLAGKYDLISWVPCSFLRKWKRGYDQSELLAKKLAKELDVSAVRTLRKVRHNPKQSRAKSVAQRRANVLEAYRPWKPEQFRGKRILLIDDVLTTGATLSECGKTLRLAGAGKLVCAVLAAVHGE